MPQSFPSVFSKQLGITVIAFGLAFCTVRAETHWDEYTQEIQPLLEEYCFDCHGEGIKKGGLDFDQFRNHESMITNRKQWTKIQNNLRHSIMPPEDEAQPSDDEREKILSWIKKSVFYVDPNNPNPGRVTVRRMNQKEFRNSIMHLTGVWYDPKHVLPPDDSGYGFNNIADVLTLSPRHIEQYLHVARTVVSKSPERYLFVDRNETDDDKAFARKSIQRLAERGFRRPIAEQELERLLLFYQQSRDQGLNAKEAIRQTCIAIIISPDFLFRELENLEKNTDEISKVSEITLASRISYFLLGSIPDDHLRNLAQTNSLRKNINQEIDRLLKKEHTHWHLADTFFSQWLRTGNVNLSFRKTKTHKKFNNYRNFFAKESELFFRHIIRENRPVLDIIDADYTYANEVVARHYGIYDIKGEEFRKISLTGLPRRGIFTHTSVLTATANPDRTSPVNRGKWLLEAILDQRPPPPPPDVTDLTPSKKLANATIRQQLEEHRANPACASCHKMMDGIGFAFERYDNIGRWINDEKAADIDTSGSLHTGEQFAGLNELIDLLSEQKQEDFIRSMSKNMLTFALGRGTEFYDEPAIEKITKAVKKDPRIHTMVRAVIQSVPFQMMRGTTHKQVLRQPNKKKETNTNG